MEGPLFDLSFHFFFSVIPTEVEGPLFDFSTRTQPFHGKIRCAVVYHVYMMASASGVLYIGITNNLEVRVLQHKHKELPSFSADYNTTKLVYFEPFGDVRDAIAREKQLKRWRREKKVFLIEKQNPRWLDLSESFHR